MGNKRRFAFFLALCFCVAFLPGCTASGEERNILFYDYFDTVIELSATGMKNEDFQKMRALAEEKLAYYHKLFDKYHTYDGINNLKTINDEGANVPVAIEPPLLELLSDGIRWCGETGGALDISQGALLELWSECREEKRLPEDAELAEAMAHTGIEKIILDETGGTVGLSQAGVSLDLGALAKGYAIEETAKALEQAGYASFLINGGGNVKAVGTAARSGGLWLLGLKDPQKEAAGLLLTVETPACSMVTSGGYQRYFTVDGVDYGHIIDPKTGYPAGAILSATAVTEDSGIADMLSTALFLLDEAAGRALCKEYDAQGIWVYPDGSISLTDGLKNKVTIIGKEE